MIGRRGAPDAAAVHTSNAVPKGARASAAAIVIGMDSPTGLQSARILARRGVRVLGVSSDPKHPCCRTNACEQIIHADTRGPGLLDELARRGPQQEARGVLFPCTDLSVLLVSRHREELEPWYHVVLPPKDVVEMLIDKASFHAFAEREGLPVPRTFVLRTRDDARAAADALEFPCIVKPSLKTLAWQVRKAAKAYRITSGAELIRFYDRSGKWAAAPLVAQEWVPGPDSNHYTCNAYFDGESAPLVTFTTRKLRQWPITGGEGCLSEEIRNEAVEEQTIRLFRVARHRGLGYLEMKQDARTGQHLIIEPNIGRPTGRSAQAEAAGVELLYTMYSDALGLPIPAEPRRPYQSVKWIHARRDFQAALHHWRRGELSLAEWFRSWRGPKVDALFSWRDPIPFWADLARVTLDAALRRTAQRNS